MNPTLGTGKIIEDFIVIPEGSFEGGGKIRLPFCRNDLEDRIHQGKGSFSVVAADSLVASGAINVRRERYCSIKEN